MEWEHGKNHVMGSDRLRESTLEAMNAAAQRQWQREHAPLWLPWNALPSTAARRKIRALRLRVDHDDRGIAYPRTVAELRALEYLSMPLAFAGQLEPGSVPESVRALSFDESPSVASSATIRRDVVLPNVGRVESYSGPLHFAHESFPNLHSVALCLAKRSKMSEVLARYRQLRFVHLGPIHEPAELEFLAALGVESLGIASGRLATLSGLEQLRKLKVLHLKNLRALHDIRTIAELPVLEKVSIQYCGALRDLGPLVEAPRLRDVEVVSCNAIRLADVAPALKTRRFTRVAITGKRHLYRGESREWIEKLA